MQKRKKGVGRKELASLGIDTLEPIISEPVTQPMADDSPSAKASGGSTAPPPELDPDDFEAWLFKVSMWTLATSIKPEKQGPTLVLACSKHTEAIMSIDATRINSGNVVQGNAAKVGLKFDAPEGVVEVIETLCKAC